MNNPGGYCLIDFKNPTTDGKTIRGIYQKIGAAYNSGKILIISNFAPTPLALWVTKVESEEVEIEGENVTFDKYTIGVYNTKENDKNYENVVTVRYNDEVKLSKTEITSGSELPEIVGNEGKFLKNVANVGPAWENVNEVPPTDDSLGKFLKAATTGAMWVDLPEEIPDVDDKPAGTALVSTPTGDYEWGHPSVSEVRLLDEDGDEYEEPFIYIGNLVDDDLSGADCEKLAQLSDRYASAEGLCEYNGVLPQITVAEGDYPGSYRSIKAVQLLTYEFDRGNLLWKATFLYYNDAMQKYMLVQAIFQAQGPIGQSNITIIHTFGN